MAFYMTQFSYTAEAWRALVTNPQDRAASTGKMIEAADPDDLETFLSWSFDRPAA